MRTVACMECGEAFTSKRTTAMFCCAEHRLTFNTRRRDRGAELYDLFMSYKHGDMSSTRYADELRKIVNAYEAADKAKRQGRRSWQPWRLATLKLPVVYGSNGDDR